MAGALSHYFSAFYQCSFSIQVSILHCENEKDYSILENAALIALSSRHGGLLGALESLHAGDQDNFSLNMLRHVSICIDCSDEVSAKDIFELDSGTLLWVAGSQSLQQFVRYVSSVIPGNKDTIQSPSIVDGLINALCHPRISESPYVRKVWSITRIQEVAGRNTSIAFPNSDLLPPNYCDIFIWLTQICCDLFYFLGSEHSSQITSIVFLLDAPGPFQYDFAEKKLWIALNTYDISHALSAWTIRSRILGEYLSHTLQNLQQQLDKSTDDPEYPLVLAKLRADYFQCLCVDLNISSLGDTSAVLDHLQRHSVRPHSPDAELIITQATFRVQEFLATGEKIFFVYPQLIKVNHKGRRQDSAIVVTSRQYITLTGSVFEQSCLIKCHLFAEMLCVDLFSYNDNPGFTVWLETRGGETPDLSEKSPTTVLATIFNAYQKRMNELPIAIDTNRLHPATETAYSNSFALPLLPVIESSSTSHLISEVAWCLFAAWTSFRAKYGQKEAMVELRPFKKEANRKFHAAAVTYQHSL